MFTVTAVSASVTFPFVQPLRFTVQTYSTQSSTRNYKARAGKYTRRSRNRFPSWAPRYSVSRQALQLVIRIVARESLCDFAVPSGRLLEPVDTQVIKDKRTNTPCQRMQRNRLRECVIAECIPVLAGLIVAKSLLDLCEVTRSTTS